MRPPPSPERGPPSPRSSSSVQPAARRLQSAPHVEAVVIRTVLLILVLLSTLTLGGCEVVGGIFKAGVYTGVIVIVLILVAVAFLWRKMR